MIISLTYHSIYHSSGPTQSLMIEIFDPNVNRSFGSPWKAVLYNLQQQYQTFFYINPIVRVYNI